MKIKRYLLQAGIGGVMFLLFKLTLGREFTLESVMREGFYALLFAVFYWVYLYLRDRIGNRSRKE
jgi:ABC-type Fe3+-siderophore transport system permease subunit